jgi:hypothetical protein
MVLNGNNANNPPQFVLLNSEAQTLGIQVLSLDVRTPSDIGPAFGNDKLRPRSDGFSRHEVSSALPELPDLLDTSPARWARIKRKSGSSWKRVGEKRG